MTVIAMSGDPLGHHRRSFLVEEEEGVAGEEERYVSDSDDDDVDRFVFLARQPAPAEASEDGDGDGDAMPPRGGGGGGGGRKRRLREMLLADDDPPVAAKDKEARLGLAAPRGASSAGEVSGNEESSPERGDLFDLGKKNKKHRDRGVEPKEQRAVRGKGSSGGAQHRDVTAEQKTPVVSAAAAAGAPRRFMCSMCGRCFGSHQALGGHVHFGHRKKAKDVAGGGGNGDRGVKHATVGREAADGNATHGEGKAAAGSKTVDFAAHDQDVDARSFLGRNAGNTNEEAFTGAANHGGDEVVEEAGGHGSLAVAAGRPHGKVRKTQHRCEVCGKECPSGQALGGHMRKHRKQSTHDVDAGKERRKSPELDWIPTQRAAVITGERELGWI